MTRLLKSFALVACAFAIALSARAETSKADRVFLKNGLVVQAMCEPANVLHLKTLEDCGFTGVLWPGKSNMKQLGPPPGLPWSRWITEDVTSFPPEERPYLPNLVALQFHDEQNLNNDKELTAAKKWFDDMREKFPNVILYTNQYGGLFNPDSNFARYIQACKPDMLSFDTYPIWEKSDNWRSYFGDLQRYRAFSTASGIPFQSWMQTFHGEDKYRDPSESELRLDIFGAWTFGAKMQTCFTYNAGSSSLFKKTFNGSGDTQLQPGYFWLQKILRESRNLSPYLCRLRCVDAKWIVSKGGEYPWGVAPWGFDKEWPELRGISVKNLGSVHGGEAGDVAIGFFKPIEGGEGERWIMVTNALADATGNAEACTQRITLNLVPNESQTIQIASRTTGKLLQPDMKRVGNSGRYLLELTIPGGAGELLRLRPPN